MLQYPLACKISSLRRTLAVLSMCEKYFCRFVSGSGSVSACHVYHFPVHSVCIFDLRILSESMMALFPILRCLLYVVPYADLWLSVPSVCVESRCII